MIGTRDIIEIKNISKNYKEIDIFKRLKGHKSKIGINNISLNVKEGEIFSIIGLNGSGKTTLMKCMLGLLKPDFGEIKVFGKSKLKRKDYYNIGYLPEISYYPKEVRLKDLINYYAELYNMDRLNRNKIIDEIFEILKLKGREKDKLENFSKGMVQKVGIAQAIMNEPKLLFLDEPMSGLDPLGRKLVMDIIKKMKSKGTTIILNTHILSDVEKLSDRIVILDSGELKSVVDFKNYMQIKSKYQIKITKPYKNFVRLGSFYVKNVIETELDEIIGDLILRGVKIVDIEKLNVSLERYFIEQIS
ncbi:ABC transporter ATP-binding protein [Haliovirga abyssi]|uniref:ABC transporter ATP-binding protein n=1 Tax=Haliovirga abyssi TaxID=2996794 RepID=A0AAU9DE21_9FUSO|nr:ABC transporter ATP-binding protein [Haliovirga abyssi]BDU49567.1 ABC transporter ATP-binding protein [Haliovirga abyssi]